LQRRIVALLAAYAIALSSLVASFALARTAAAATVPGGIICHTAVAGDEAPSPASDQTGHCADNCCIGCLMHLAALPAPVKAVGAPLVAASQPTAPPRHLVLTGDLKTKDHRSRAPPLAA
jgi:hypothetical protein